MRYFIFLAGILLLGGSCTTTRQAAPSGNFTANGFAYVRHIGNEGPRPQEGEYVLFHVIMANGDSVLFDSDKQAQMPMVQIPLPGNQPVNPSPVIDGIRLMAVGDSLTVRYPIDTTAFSPAGLENSDFITYHLTLRKILGADQYRQEQSFRQRSIGAEEKDALRKREEAAVLETRFRWKQYRTGQIDHLLQTTSSGLRYIPLEEGLGESPGEAQWVRIHYYGILMDGTEFANTFAQGRELSVQIGEEQVPAGMEEAVLQLKKGGKSILFIPWELGYGAEGHKDIPPRAELIVYLEMAGIIE